jgi:hypothetical protein
MNVGEIIITALIGEMVRQTLDSAFASLLPLITAYKKSLDY